MTRLKNIYNAYKYGPGGHKGDTRMSEVSISSVSGRLELWRHKLVCLSMSFFPANPIAKLADHIWMDIDPTVSSSGSHMSRACPDVHRGRPRWKILSLLATDSVVVPISAIFIESFLEQGRP